MTIRKLSFIPLYLAVSAIPAWGGDDTVLHALGLSEEKEATAPVFRTPRPASLIAENVTVVTAEDIVRLNARTLDEVLQTVSGIQLIQVRTPGSKGVFSLNGASSLHVLVLIDGIPQNLLGAEESAELGMIPVQRIQRIEIIKGAASVAWGPALGGVVNVITRDPDSESKLGGIASFSYGEKSSSDFRGGVSGAVDKLGYYLDGGRYSSNGLLPDNNVTLDHFFGKFTYDLPSKGRLSLGADLRVGNRGIGRRILEQGAVEVDSSGTRYASGYLRFDYPLQDRLNLEFMASAGGKDIWEKWEIRAPVNFLIFDARNRTESQQAVAKLTWGNIRNNIAAGVEYLHDRIVVSEPQNNLPFLNLTRDLNRYGTYLSGAFSLGSLTLLPGIRFDQINSKNVTSYNIGSTWFFNDKTLLRIYAAKGYSLPIINFGNDMQNIWTLQAGIESSAIPLLWVKSSFFYAETSNIQSFFVPADYPASSPYIIRSEQRSKGMEFELRTVPFYDISLAAGFTYSHSRSNKKVRTSYIPDSITKIALYYNNGTKGFRATVTGSHVNWPSDTGNSVRDNQMIMDIHLSQKLSCHAGLCAEIFFSGHNFLNSSQYIDDYRKNAPQWFEVGIRFKF